MRSQRILGDVGLATFGFLRKKPIHITIKQLFSLHNWPGWQKGGGYGDGWISPSHPLSEREKLHHKEYYISCYVASQWEGL